MPASLIIPAINQSIWLQIDEWLAELTNEEAGSNKLTWPGELWLPDCCFHSSHSIKLLIKFKVWWMESEWQQFASKKTKLKAASISAFKTN